MKLNPLFFSLVGHFLLLFLFLGAISLQRYEKDVTRHVQVRFISEEANFREAQLPRKVLESTSATKQGDKLATPVQANNDFLQPKSELTSILSSMQPPRSNLVVKNSSQTNRCIPDSDLLGVRVSMTPAAIREHLGVSPLNQMLEPVDGRQVLLEEYLLKSGKLYTFVFSGNSLETYASANLLSIVYSFRDNALQRLYASGSISLVELERRRLHTYSALYANGAQGDFFKTLIKRYQLAFDLERGVIDSVSYQSNIFHLTAALNSNQRSCST